MKEYNCNECIKNGVISKHSGRANLLAHYKEAHPNFVPRTYNKKPKAEQKSGLYGAEAVYAAEHNLREAVKQLEAQRDMKMTEIKALDDLIAKYRKF